MGMAKNDRPKADRDDALDPIVDGIDNPPDDVDGRRKRTGDNYPCQEPIANAPPRPGPPRLMAGYFLRRMRQRL